MVKRKEEKKWTQIEPTKSKVPFNQLIKKRFEDLRVGRVQLYIVFAYAFIMEPLVKLVVLWKLHCFYQNVQ